MRSMLKARKESIGLYRRVPALPVFAVAARGGATSAGEDDHDEGDQCGDHELGRPARLDGHAGAESERPEIDKQILSYTSRIEKHWLGKCMQNKNPFFPLYRGPNAPVLVKKKVTVDQILTSGNQRFMCCWGFRKSGLKIEKQQQ